MNSTNFEKWVVEKLIPGLPKNSVLVLDYAPYHNYQSEKCPTSNSSKSELMQWISNKKIPFTPNMFKPELHKLVKMNKPLENPYKIDSILGNHGHTVIRLPPVSYTHLSKIDLNFLKEFEKKGTLSACNQQISSAVL